MKRLFKAVTLAAVALVTYSAFAQMKPEDAIKYRQSALFLMGQNFGPLAAMAKGDRPYDKEAAAKYAANLEFLSKLPPDGFKPGTDKGNTKAKSELWDNIDDFSAKMEKMQSEAVKLAEAAKNGDLAALKAQVGETGKACKACHDKYRNKD